jgi:hypothetical protein
MSGEDDTLQLMESWKVKGNDAMRLADSLRAARSPNCSNFYRQAIRHYTSALAVRTNPDIVSPEEDASLAALRIVCLANRAAAHLARGNFGLALRDSVEADALYLRAPPPPPPPPPAAIDPEDAAQRRQEVTAPAPPAAPSDGLPLMDRVIAKCRTRAAAACLRLRRCGVSPRRADGVGPLALFPLGA